MKNAILIPALFAWGLSILAMLGSLYFSEVMHFPPCTLCWYQRIAIYPLAFLIPMGIIRKDVNLPYYILSIIVPGFLVSIYHNLLYYGILPETIAPCAQGVSCITKYIEWYGFITIPLLSLFTITAIMISMFVLIRNQK
ncbi:MAG: disulfide oxidoreductase [bacterium]|nr:disulfide oxidoreductase [bacterium]